MSLKENIVANFAGQGWRAVLSFALLPLYINYLGIESFGLIGIFALVQAWLALLDLGLRPAVSREMARYLGGAVGVQHVCDLLRTVETLAMAMAATVAVVIWLASHWLAANWVVARSLSVSELALAFSIMGIIAAASFLDNVFISSLVGLQRQVLQNAISVIVATVRGFGALAVLAWVSPTIHAFFLWQLAVSVTSVALNAAYTYRSLPSPPRKSCFSLEALHSVTNFALGIAGITLLSLLLTQVDKVLLSRLLTLESFAYYSLACTVSSALYMVVGPISNAIYPRFTELVARNDESGLIIAYHKCAQLVSVLLVPAAIMLAFFGNRILLLWTGNVTITNEVAPLLAILAIGTMIHGFMWIPYQLQLANGWTGLANRINVVAVGILVPTILWAVPRYGAIGAAWIWLVLNIGYLTLGVHFMHRRLLINERWRWYLHDILVPPAAPLLMASVCQVVIPIGLTKFSELAFLALMSGGVFTASAASASGTRKAGAALLLVVINKLVSDPRFTEKGKK